MLVACQEEEARRGQAQHSLRVEPMRIASGLGEGFREREAQMCPWGGAGSALGKLRRCPGTGG